MLVHQVIFTMIYEFVKHTPLFILGAHFLCTLLGSMVHGRCMFTSMHLIFEALNKFEMYFFN